MPIRQPLCKWCKGFIHRDINRKWEHDANGMFDCDTSKIDSKEAEYGGWVNYG